MIGFLSFFGKIRFHIRILESIKANPRKLFLVDGVGAALSAFLIGVVLVHFTEELGVSRSTLSFLAGLPVGFLVYDIICYFSVRIPVAKMLRGIAIMNLLYCGISVGFLVNHWETISWWGWVYFGLEIALVGVLAWVEMIIR